MCPPFAAHLVSAITFVTDPTVKSFGLRCPRRVLFHAAFRAQHLALVCAKLDITLIHARPGDCCRPLTGQPARSGKVARPDTATESNARPWEPVRGGDRQSTLGSSVKNAAGSGTPPPEDAVRDGMGSVKRHGAPFAPSEHGSADAEA